MGNRFTTIRGKQTITTLLICLSGMLMVALICQSIARKAILTETINELIHVSGQEAEVINGWLAKQKTILETTGVNLQIIDDYNQIQPVISGVTVKNPEIQNIIVGLGTGEGIFANDAPTPDFIATQRPWYSMAKENRGQTIVTAPYRGTVSNLMMITFAMDLGVIDGVDAVISLDVTIADLLEAVSNISVHQKGTYAFLADQAGRIITHPDAAFQPEDDDFISMLENPFYAQAYASRKNNDPYIKLTDYDGVNRYVISKDIAETGWSIYIAVPERSIYQGINSGIPQIVIVSLVVMVVSFFLIHWVTRIIIVKPLEAMSEYAQNIVDGNFEVSFRQNRRDEIGMVMNDFTEVADSIEMLVGDMNIMTAQHQDSNLDFRLDESKYKGAYHEVVVGINEMVSIYINNFMDIMEILDRFGKGDFYVLAKQYPGKLSACNESIESFRANLIRVNKEIQNLAENALQGNLSVKADTSGLYGDWSKMVTGLNDVLEAVMTPIQESVKVLDALSQGNLQVHMVGDYRGDFALIANSVNATIASLSAYIRTISETLSKVADNNLDVFLATEFAGEFVAIKNYINKIIETQNKMFNEIFLSGEQVNVSAKAVSDSSTDIMSATLTQNAIIKKLNQLVGFVHEQTLKNTGDAKAAEESSHKAVSSASHGAKEMEKMVQSMSDIKNSSDNISNIINVINDIANQTNLLALNAAVEAARAGTSGKGFAVVAEEVRNLAVKSQKAAQESQLFVEEVLGKINDGTNNAFSTSDALDEIVLNISDVSSYATNIFQSSSEQSHLVGEISQSIDAITSAADDVLKSSESGAATAKELYRQSEFLNTLLNRFQIKSGRHC